MDNHSDHGATPGSGGDGRLGDLTVVPDMVDQLRAAGLTSLDALFRVAPDQVLNKPGLSVWRERLRITLPDSSGRQPSTPPLTAYLKRYIRPPRRAYRGLKSPHPRYRSLAAMEWAWLHVLQQSGFPAPLPIAFGEEMRGPRETRSALLIAAVPGESLERLAPTLESRDRTRILALLNPVAELVARFHGLGLVHRDLYLAHIFADEASDSKGPPSLHLIDAARIFRPGIMPRRWIAKDIAALAYSTPRALVSTIDRARWLRSYLGTRRLGREGRRLWYHVDGKVRRIARHDQRRRTRLANGAASGVEPWT